MPTGDGDSAEDLVINIGFCSIPSFVDGSTHTGQYGLDFSVRVLKVTRALLMLIRPDHSPAMNSKQGVQLHSAA